MDAWRIEVTSRDGMPDPAGATATSALRSAGLTLAKPVRAWRGYLLGSELQESQVRRFAEEVLSDPVGDRFEVHAPGTAPKLPRRISIVPLPGVTDPVAHSVQKALADLGLPKVSAGTYRAFEFAEPVNPQAAVAAARKSLANEVVQHVLLDELPSRLPGAGANADLSVRPFAVLGLSGPALAERSKQAGLALTEREMATVQAHFAGLRREPTQLEIETIAQTWSEHCKHKTLTGRIRFAGQIVDNLLKQTIAHVTHELNRDFCVSVFKDNAGVIAFDDVDCVCIKVETHNHPSAIEPFGGAGTGVGGVIRDVLGTGLGARPIASTDVFCLAPPDLPESAVPPGCLPPLTVLKGVVAGVRDYGNPMGIPTVHGAVHFDPDFVGNPLVYVGNIGILPRNKVEKRANPGDVIVVIGGRTGRDGIHGATFSSLELHTESESISSGAVQIGDPITERKVMDAVLRCRDEGLFTAVTDCGAGGFSSAVGEMAEEVGAVVDLAKAPLKYAGLAPWEIWISEAQERMVLAVPPRHLQRVLTLCSEEDVEGTAIGTFEATGRLVVKHGAVVHGDLDLHFLHKGLPVFEREAVYVPALVADPELPVESDLNAALLACLSDLNVASKEWIIRQYDHEVQAASAGKPLVGRRDDGPADATVLAPKLGSRRGIVLASGLNPRYSKIDPAAMAQCALDEALRNIVSAGGDPEYTAVLDNYCWGNCAIPDRLGGLVRASFALRDQALVYRTPFVSGKDSLNNEFRAADKTVVIPGCILVTAMSVIPDVGRTLTTDLKAAGNLVYLVGTTKRELGGSVYWKTKGELGACVPRVDAQVGKRTLDAVARAIAAKAVVSSHDLSEGGLGVAAAEMCIGGRLGIDLDLGAVPVAPELTRAEEILFSESQSRFLLEVAPDRAHDLELNLAGVPFACIGKTTAAAELVVRRGGKALATLAVDRLAKAWKSPLDFDGTLTKEVSA